MTISDKQTETFERLMNRNDVPIAGKNIREQRRSLCSLFQARGVPLSTNCAEKLIALGKDKKRLVVDDNGTLRTLNTEERRLVREESSVAQEAVGVAA